MFKQLIDKAIYLKIVSSENREIYEYGITNLSYSLLVWSIFLLSAFLFGFFPSALFFLLTHIPLRIYAGGLHFSTRIRCFIASLFIFAVVLFFPLAFSSFKLCKAINPFIILGLIIILFFAPVEDPHWSGNFAGCSAVTYWENPLSNKTVSVKGILSLKSIDSFLKPL